jgi:hypothetical protein
MAYAPHEEHSAERPIEDARRSNAGGQSHYSRLCQFCQVRYLRTQGISRAVGPAFTATQGRGGRGPQDLTANTRCEVASPRWSPGRPARSALQCERQRDPSQPEGAGSARDGTPATAMRDVWCGQPEGRRMPLTRRVGVNAGQSRHGHLDRPLAEAGTATRMERTPNASDTATVFGASNRNA